MYEDPGLYSKKSEGHQKEAKYLLENYAAKTLQWKGNETALDLGCGPGDVTNNVLLPYVAENVKSIRAIDLDPKMIEFGKRRYENSKIKFDIADIGLPMWDKIEPVDKIFSFFAIQWVPNKDAVAANIFNCLKPGGQAFLVIVARNGIYYVWDRVANSDKWKKYLPDAPERINEYAYSSDPEGMITCSLEKAGLKIDFSSTVERKNVFKAAVPTDEDMIKMIRMVDPYVKKLPEELRNTYLTEVLEILKETVSPTGANDYTALIVTASKPK